MPDLVIKDPIKFSIENIGQDKLSKIKLALKERNFQFEIPEKHQSNSEKIIYYTGFLYILLSNIYPKFIIEDIVKKLNNDHFIFLGPRQLRRNKDEFILNNFVSE